MRTIYVEKCRTGVTATRVTVDAGPQALQELTRIVRFICLLGFFCFVEHSYFFWHTFIRVKHILLKAAEAARFSAECAQVISLSLSK